MLQTLGQALSQGLRVEEGRPRLIATHNGEDLTFLHPAYGPNTYAVVGAEIERAGLKKPTMAQTVSLVYAAFNSDDVYSKEIRDIMRNRWLWGFTGTLYVPKKGVYIEDYPKIKNEMPSMEESELVKKLEGNDSSVRFVPFGYQIGEMSSLQLAKNAYVIALAGEEGAEKLARVAERYRHNPNLFSFKSVDKPLTRVSAVDSYWGLDLRLGVNGSYHGADWDGCAFGVSEKTGVASRAEK